MGDFQKKLLCYNSTVHTIFHVICIGFCWALICCGYIFSSYWYMWFIHIHQGCFIATVEIILWYYRKTSNISRTVVGNKIVDNFILDLTHGFNGLSNTTARRDEKHLSFEIWWPYIRDFTVCDLSIFIKVASLPLWKSYCCISGKLWYLHHMCWRYHSLQSRLCHEFHREKLWNIHKKQGRPLKIIVPICLWRSKETRAVKLFLK